MPSLYDESRLYQAAFWALGITLGVVLILIIVAMSIYINAGIRLNRTQQIGKRLETECGKEMTERETERYYIYNLVQEQNLRKKIASSVALIRSISGIIIIGFIFAYSFWTLLIFKGTKPIGDPIAVSVFTNFTKFKKGNLWVGLLFAIPLITVLMMGSIGTFLRAASINKYHVDVQYGSDEIASVTSTLNKLNNQVRKKVSFIGSPWFPISFVFAYGVIMHLFTTLLANKGGMKVGDYIDGNRIERRGVILWISLIVVYFIAALAAWFADKDYRIIIATIENYKQKKFELETYIENLLNDTNETTTPSPIKKALRQYFKTWIEAVTKKEVSANTIGTRGNYKDELWKFIQHEGGNEMQEIFKDPARTNSVKTAIENIRTWAVQMRMMKQPMHDAASRLSKHAIWMGVTLFVLLFFIVFNILSRMWSSTNTAIASLAIVFLFAIFSSWFGWFSSALML